MVIPYGHTIWLPYDIYHMVIPHDYTIWIPYGYYNHMVNNHTVCIKYGYITIWYTIWLHYITIWYIIWLYNHITIWSFTIWLFIPYGYNKHMVCTIWYGTPYGIIPYGMV